MSGTRANPARAARPGSNKCSARSARPGVAQQVRRDQAQLHVAREAFRSQLRGGGGRGARAALPAQFGEQYVQRGVGRPASQCRPDLRFRLRRVRPANCSARPRCTNNCGESRRGAARGLRVRRAPRRCAPRCSRKRARSKRRSLDPGSMLQCEFERFARRVRTLHICIEFARYAPCLGGDMALSVIVDASVTASGSLPLAARETMSCKRSRSVGRVMIGVVIFIGDATFHGSPRHAATPATIGKTALACATRSRYTPKKF